MSTEERSVARRPWPGFRDLAAEAHDQLGAHCWPFPGLASIARPAISRPAPRCQLSSVSGRDPGKLASGPGGAGG